MVVEWFHNGQLLPASSRINAACQFGFVSLDMLNTTAEDAGEYTCVVKSDSGLDKSFCTLSVTSRREIESEMHSQSLRSVQESAQVQQVVVQEEVVPPPNERAGLTRQGSTKAGAIAELRTEHGARACMSLFLDAR